MYFKRILISDINKHTARLQEFSEGLNVITSEDNHVGKSSLLKSLYYTLGAEVDFDNIWEKKTKVYIVDFMVGNIEYRIARYQKHFALFENHTLMLLTDSVGKDLAKAFEKIFSFSIYLPNKNKRVELAPPVFTFMPYYIDQDNGWSGVYNSFERLDQYDKSTRIKSLLYHLNIYNKQTIDLMAKRDLLKDQIELLKKDEEKNRITIESLASEVQNLMPAETLDELERNLQIPKEKIATLVSLAGEVRNKIQEIETVLQKHIHQLQIIEEYNQMKIDMTDTINSDRIHSCPKCGYTFDEEIYDIVRSNYNIQNEQYMKQQIQLIIDSISDELNVYQKKYVLIMDELKEQEKVYDERQDSYSVYLRQRGLSDSINHFSEQLNENILNQHEKENEIKSINKQLRKLPNKKEIEEKYIEYVRENIIQLGAWNNAYEGSIKLLKPIKAQGTLENKIILAQFVGLFQTMNSQSSNTIRFPFVVDSPRAKEASHASSKDIIKMICELDILPQVILATMDYEEFASSKNTTAKIIKYSEKHHLLNAETYENNRVEIEEMWNLLKNQ